MKKILSLLLAFSVLLAMGSGAVLFGADANEVAVVGAEVSDYDAAKKNLNELLNMADSLGFFDDDSDPRYEIAAKADAIYSESESTLEQLREQIGIIRLLVAKEVTDDVFYKALEKAQNAWEHNYDAALYASLIAATDEAWANYETDPTAATAMLTDACEALVPIKTQSVTGNLFEGWTTEDVNALVEANSSKLCDSIGNGLNESGVYNYGDFSKNTIFEADDNFSMTALKDFSDASMGWKNMDRSGRVAGHADDAYPTMDVTGIVKAEGIRFKLEVTGGSVERLLFGFSNCVDMVREMYALKIKPEYVDENGYINIPFSCFEAAHWASAFEQDELENIIVFIIEAYNVTEGTTVTVSDISGYVALRAPTDEQKSKVADVVGKLAEFDIDGRYSDLMARAEALGENSYGVEYEEIYKEIMGILKAFKVPSAAIVDVPGFSVYSQEEMDQIVGYKGGIKLTKTERGMKHHLVQGKGDWTFANGVYVPGTGFEDDPSIIDALFGEVTPIGGKNFIDMLGGYTLGEIYAYRFKVEDAAPGKAMSISYKDGIGLWDGMLTDDNAVLEGSDGYFTYIIEESAVGKGSGGWYGDVTLEDIKTKTKYAVFSFYQNVNKDIYGWQVILYNPIDRSALKEALEAFAELGVIGYDAAMELYYDANATETGIANAVEKLIANANPKAPEAPVADKVTHSSITLKAGAKNIEYKIEGGEWTGYPVFEGLEPNTAYTFYTRVAASGVIPASDPSKATVITTLKAPIEGEVVIEGNAVYGETLRASIVNANTDNLGIAWKRDGKTVGKGGEYTLSKEDIGYSLTVEVTSAEVSGSIVSDATAVVAKATPVILGEIGATELYFGEALGATLPAVQFNVEGTVEWATPDVVPALDQSGSTFKAIFTPADTDCYETVEFDVVVTIDTDTETRILLDEKTGINIIGDFVKGKEIATEFGDIDVGTNAYLSILRAARGSEAANNLFLFKNIDLNEDNCYVGTLTLSAKVGVSRANTEYTVWFFVDGQVASATGSVDARGILTVEGITI